MKLLFLGILGCCISQISATERVSCKITYEAGCKNYKEKFLEMKKDHDYTVEECYDICSNHPKCGGFFLGKNGRSGDCMLARKGCEIDGNRNWVHYSMDDCAISYYYYVGSANGTCVNELDVIKTRKECTIALSKTGQPVSGEYVTVSSDEMPSGCSRRTEYHSFGGDIQPYFNDLKGIGNGRKELIPICKKSFEVCEQSGCDQCFRNNNCIAYGQYSEISALTCTMLGGTDCSAAQK